MAEILDGKPTIRRYLIAPLCAAVIFGAISYCGYRAYAHWEPEHLVKEAEKSFAKGDYASASLQVQRAIQINNGNAAAARLYADILEVQGAPQEVAWRRHVLDLAPNGVDDKLAWLTAAIRLNKPDLAEKAMATFTDQEKKSAAFESREGALAASQGKDEEAAKHYAEAMKLDAGDQRDRYNYGMMLLRSKDPNVRLKGMETLKGLGADAGLSASANRVLVRTLASEGKTEEALAMNGVLQGGASAEFVDLLMHLDLLDRLKKPEESAYLAKVETEAAKAPERAGLLIDWLRGRGRMVEALGWAWALPKAMQETPECGEPMAECLLAISDWGDLRLLTGKVNWKKLEYLRLAMLARAEGETGGDEAAEAHWTRALGLAANDRVALERLRALALGWGPRWEGKLEPVLLALGKGWGDTPSLKELYYIYTKRNNTAGLLDVTREIAKNDPGNRMAANNAVMFMLLLNSNVAEAVKKAEELYESDRGDAVFASTYAYGLALEGDAAKGLKVMESLGEKKLSEPGVAAYYGVLLVANDEPDKGLPFLEMEKGDANLLPEEAKLVNRTLDVAHGWEKAGDAANVPDWKKTERIRLAALARAQYENGEEKNSELNWQKCLAMAVGEKAALEELRGVVSTWGWESRLNDVLLEQGKRWKDEGALQVLEAKYQKAGDTADLWEVSKAMVANEPGNQDAAIRFARYSLLLNRDLPGAVKVAEALYQSDRGNAAFATVYGYGLHLEGRSGEGLKAMESLDAKAVSEPGTAPYYGVLLAANNQKGKAAGYLQIAKNESDLLPEERTAVERALALISKK